MRFLNGASQIPPAPPSLIKNERSLTLKTGWLVDSQISHSYFLKLFGFSNFSHHKALCGLFKTLQSALWPIKNNTKRFVVVIVIIAIPPQEKRWRLYILPQCLANLTQPIFGTRKAIVLQYLSLYFRIQVCMFLLLNVHQMRTNVHPDRPNATKTLTVLTQWVHMTALVKTDTPGMDSFVQVRN